MTELSKNGKELEPQGAKGLGKALSRLQSLGRVSFAFVIPPTVAVIWHCQPSVPAATAAIVWTTACFVVGTGIGFLFGLPKVLQNGKPGEEGHPGDNSYAPQINTNLYQISDWLTKTIVGVSLVEIQKFKPLLKTAADLVGQSISANGAGQNERGFAAGLILAYTSMGLLFGYLYTRSFLSLLFSEADQTMLRNVQRQVSDTAEQVHQNSMKTEATSEAVQGMAKVMANQVVLDPQKPDATKNPEEIKLLQIASESVRNSGKEAASPGGLYLIAYTNFALKRYKEAIPIALKGVEAGPSKETLWALYNLLGLSYHYLQPDNWKPGGPTDWLEAATKYYSLAIENSPGPQQELLTKGNLAFVHLDAANFGPAENLASEIIARAGRLQDSRIDLLSFGQLIYACAAAMQNKNEAARNTLNGIQDLKPWSYLFENGDISKQIVQKLAELEGMLPAHLAFLNKFI